MCVRATKAHVPGAVHTAHANLDASHTAWVRDAPGEAWGSGLSLGSSRDPYAHLHGTSAGNSPFTPLGGPY